MLGALNEEERRVWNGGGGTSEGVTQVFEIFIFQFKLQKLARYGF